MATEEKTEFKKIGQLTKEQFYQYALAFEKMQHASTKLKLKEKVYAIMGKELLILQLKMAAFRGEANLSKQYCVNAEQEYKKILKELSDETGIELEGKGINPITYEVAEEVKIKIAKEE